MKKSAPRANGEPAGRPSASHSTQHHQLQVHVEGKAAPSAADAYASGNLHSRRIREITATKFKHSSGSYQVVQAATSFPGVVSGPHAKQADTPLEQATPQPRDRKYTSSNHNGNGRYRNHHEYSPPPSGVKRRISLRGNHKDSSESSSVLHCLDQEDALNDGDSTHNHYFEQEAGGFSSGLRLRNHQRIHKNDSLLPLQSAVSMADSHNNLRADDTAKSQASAASSFSGINRNGPVPTQTIGKIPVAGEKALSRGVYGAAKNYRQGRAQEQESRSNITDYPLSAKNAVHIGADLEGLSVSQGPLELKDSPELEGSSDLPQPPHAGIPKRSIASSCRLRDGRSGRYANSNSNQTVAASPRLHYSASSNSADFACRKALSPSPLLCSLNSSSRLSISQKRFQCSSLNSRRNMVFSNEPAISILEDDASHYRPTRSSHDDNHHHLHPTSQLSFPHQEVNAMNSESCYFNHSPPISCSFNEEEHTNRGLRSSDTSDDYDQQVEDGEVSIDGQNNNAEDTNWAMAAISPLVADCSHSAFQSTRRRIRTFAIAGRQESTGDNPAVQYQPQSSPLRVRRRGYRTTAATTSSFFPSPENQRENEDLRHQQVFQDFSGRSQVPSVRRLILNLLTSCEDAMAALTRLCHLFRGKILFRVGFLLIFGIIPLSVEVHNLIPNVKGMLDNRVWIHVPQELNKSLLNKDVILRLSPIQLTYAFRKYIEIVFNRKFHLRMDPRAGDGYDNFAQNGRVFGTGMNRRNFGIRAKKYNKVFHGHEKFEPMRESSFGLGEDYYFPAHKNLEEETKGGSNYKEDRAEAYLSSSSGFFEMQSKGSNNITGRAVREEAKNLNFSAFLDNWEEEYLEYDDFLDSSYYRYYYRGSAGNTSIKGDRRTPPVNLRERNDEEGCAIHPPLDFNTILISKERRKKGHQLEAGNSAKETQAQNCYMHTKRGYSSQRASITREILPSSFSAPILPSVPPTFYDWQMQQLRFFYGQYEKKLYRKLQNYNLQRQFRLSIDSYLNPKDATTGLKRSENWAHHTNRGKNYYRKPFSGSSAKFKGSMLALKKLLFKEIRPYVLRKEEKPVSSKASALLSSLPGSLKLHSAGTSKYKANARTTESSKDSRLSVTKEEVGRHYYKANHQAFELEEEGGNHHHNRYYQPNQRAAQQAEGGKHHHYNTNQRVSQQEKEDENHQHHYHHHHYNANQRAFKTPSELPRALHQFTLNDLHDTLKIAVPTILCSSCISGTFKREVSAFISSSSPNKPLRNLQGLANNGGKNRLGASSEQKFNSKADCSDLSCNTTSSLRKKPQSQARHFDNQMKANEKKKESSTKEQAIADDELKADSSSGKLSSIKASDSGRYSLRFELLEEGEEAEEAEGEAENAGESLKKAESGFENVKNVEDLLAMYQDPENDVIYLMFEVPWTTFNATPNFMQAFLCSLFLLLRWTILSSKIAADLLGQEHGIRLNQLFSFNETLWGTIFVYIWSIGCMMPLTAIKITNCFFWISLDGIPHSFLFRWQYTIWITIITSIFLKTFLRCFSDSMGSGGAKIILLSIAHICTGISLLAILIPLISVSSGPCMTAIIVNLIGIVLQTLLWGQRNDRSREGGPRICFEERNQLYCQEVLLASVSDTYFRMVENEVNEKLRRTPEKNKPFSCLNRLFGLVYSAPPSIAPPLLGSGPNHTPNRVAPKQTSSEKHRKHNRSHEKTSEEVYPSDVPEDSSEARKILGTPCQICNVVMADTVLYPCMHGGLCEECLRILATEAAQSQHPQCPLCRAKLTCCLKYQEILEDGTIRASVFLIIKEKAGAAMGGYPWDMLNFGGGVVSHVGGGWY